MVYPACVDVRMGKLLLSIDSPDSSMRPFVVTPPAGTAPATPLPSMPIPTVPMPSLAAGAAAAPGGKGVVLGSAVSMPVAGTTTRGVTASGSGHAAQGQGQQPAGAGAAAGTAPPWHQRTVSAGALTPGGVAIRWE